MVHHQRKRQHPEDRIIGMRITLFPQQEGNDHKLQMLLMSPDDPRIRRKDVIIEGPPDEFKAAPINNSSTQQAVG